MVEAPIVNELINGPMLRLGDTVPNGVGKAWGQSRRFDIVLDTCVLVRIQGNIRLFRHSWIFYVANFLELTFCGVEAGLI